jgi:hypothetical protein
MAFWPRAGGAPKGSCHPFAPRPRPRCRFPVPPAQAPASRAAPRNPSPRAPYGAPLPIPSHPRQPYPRHPPPLPPCLFLINTPALARFLRPRPGAPPPFPPAPSVRDAWPCMLLSTNCQTPPQGKTRSPPPLWPPPLQTHWYPAPRGAPARTPRRPPPPWHGPQRSCTPRASRALPRPSLPRTTRARGARAARRHPAPGAHTHCPSYTPLGAPRAPTHACHPQL